MDVYELIRELSQFSADTEVKFFVSAKREVYVDASSTRQKKSQKVTVKFNRFVDFDSLDDNELDKNPYIVINLTD